MSWWGLLKGLQTRQKGNKTRLTREVLKDSLQYDVSLVVGDSDNNIKIVCEK